MRSSRFRAKSCAPRARAGSPRSGSSVRARNEPPGAVADDTRSVSAPARARVSRGGRTGNRGFGPDWLRERLADLLPGFPGVAVCVAVSGGIDSTALLAALAEARPEGLRLRALHVNHGLHPNAARWSAHCR